MLTPSRFRDVPTSWRIGLLVVLLVPGGCAVTVPEAPLALPSHALPKPEAVPISTLPAEPEAALDFLQWVEGVKRSARTAGVDEATLRLALDEVRYLPKVVEMDQRQPEFTRSVWDYLDTAVSAQRVLSGTSKLQQSQPTIAPIAARYRVPTEILVAIWGMESSYGSFTGDISTIDALATLGFEGRRGAWARGQLLAALKILQSREVERNQLRGSWAGAMGQTQFLPSNYLAYAVDADGDGKRDIWASTADVMASTANFMVQAGWQAGQVWGVEVRVPPSFDFANADARQATAAWAKDGVQSMDGAPLPDLPDASVLLPAGARGPAFLVGANFRAILRYNNSTSYALAVGLLSQRLAGGSGVATAWPRDMPAMTRAQLIALQTVLNAQGFDCGTPDGIVGPATRRGVRLYQVRQGMPADGYPSLSLLEQLQSTATPKTDAAGPSER